MCKFYLTKNFFGFFVPTVPRSADRLVFLCRINKFCPIFSTRIFHGHPCISLQKFHILTLILALITFLSRLLYI